MAQAGPPGPQGLPSSLEDFRRVLTHVRDYAAQFDRDEAEATRTYITYKQRHDRLVHATREHLSKETDLKQLLIEGGGLHNAVEFDHVVSDEASVELAKQHAREHQMSIVFQRSLADVEGELKEQEHDWRASRIAANPITRGLLRAIGTLLGQVVQWKKAAVDDNRNESVSAAVVQVNWQRSFDELAEGDETMRKQALVGIQQRYNQWKQCYGNPRLELVLHTYIHRLNHIEKVKPTSDQGAMLLLFLRMAATYIRRPTFASMTRADYLVSVLHELVQLSARWEVGPSGSHPRGELEGAQPSPEAPLRELMRRLLETIRGHSVDITDTVVNAMTHCCMQLERHPVVAATLLRDMVHVAAQLATLDSAPTIMDPRAYFANTVEHIRVTRMVSPAHLPLVDLAHRMANEKMPSMVWGARQQTAATDRLFADKLQRAIDQHYTLDLSAAAAAGPSTSASSSVTRKMMVGDDFASSSSSSSPLHLRGLPDTTNRPINVRIVIETLRFVWNSWTPPTVYDRKHDRVGARDFAGIRFVFASIVAWLEESFSREHGRTVNVSVQGPQSNRVWSSVVTGTPFAADLIVYARPGQLGASRDLDDRVFWINLPREWEEFCDRPEVRTTSHTRPSASRLVVTHARGHRNLFSATAFAPMHPHHNGNSSSILHSAHIPHSSVIVPRAPVTHTYSIDVGRPHVPAQDPLKKLPANYVDVLVVYVSDWYDRPRALHAQADSARRTADALHYASCVGRDLAQVSNQVSKPYVFRSRVVMMNHETLITDEAVLPETLRALQPLAGASHSICVWLIDRHIVQASIDAYVVQRQRSSASALANATWHVRVLVHTSPDEPYAFFETPSPKQTTPLQTASSASSSAGVGGRYHHTVFFTEQRAYTAHRANLEHLAAVWNRMLPTQSHIMRLWMQYGRSGFTNRELTRMVTGMLVVGNLTVHLASHLPLFKSSPAATERASERAAAESFLNAVTDTTMTAANSASGGPEFGPSVRPAYLFSAIPRYQNQSTETTTLLPPPTAAATATTRHGSIVVEPAPAVIQAYPFSTLTDRMHQNRSAVANVDAAISSPRPTTTAVMTARGKQLNPFTPTSPHRTLDASSRPRHMTPTLRPQPQPQPPHQPASYANSTLADRPVATVPVSNTRFQIRVKPHNPAAVRLPPVAIKPRLHYENSTLADRPTDQLAETPVQREFVVDDPAVRNVGPLLTTPVTQMTYDELEYQAVQLLRQTLRDWYAKTTDDDAAASQAAAIRYERGFEALREVQAEKRARTWNSVTAFFFAAPPPPDSSSSVPTASTSSVEESTIVTSATTLPDAPQHTSDVVALATAASASTGAMELYEPRTAGLGLSDAAVRKVPGLIWEVTASALHNYVLPWWKGNATDWEIMYWGSMTDRERYNPAEFVKYHWSWGTVNSEYDRVNAVTNLGERAKTVVGGVVSTTVGVAMMIKPYVDDALLVSAASGVATGPAILAYASSKMIFRTVDSLVPSAFELIAENLEAETAAGVFKVTKYGGMAIYFARPWITHFLQASEAEAREIGQRIDDRYAALELGELCRRQALPTPSNVRMDLLSRRAQERLRNGDIICPPPTETLALPTTATLPTLELPSPPIAALNTAQQPLPSSSSSSSSSSPSTSFVSLSPTSTMVTSSMIAPVNTPATSSDRPAVAYRVATQADADRAAENMAALEGIRAVLDGKKDLPAPVEEVFWEKWVNMIVEWDGMMVVRGVAADAAHIANLHDMMKNIGTANRKLDYAMAVWNAVKYAVQILQAESGVFHLYQVYRWWKIWGTLTAAISGWAYYRWSTSATNARLEKADARLAELEETVQALRHAPISLAEVREKLGARTLDKEHVLNEFSRMLPVDSEFTEAERIVRAQQERAPTTIVMLPEGGLVPPQLLNVILQANDANFSTQKKRDDATAEDEKEDGQPTDSNNDTIFDDERYYNRHASVDDDDDDDVDVDASSTGTTSSSRDDTLVRSLVRTTERMFAWMRPTTESTSSSDTSESARDPVSEELDDTESFSELSGRIARQMDACDALLHQSTRAKPSDAAKPPIQTRTRMDRVLRSPSEKETKFAMRAFLRAADAM